MTQPTERRFVMEPRLDAEVETLNTAISNEATARSNADALRVAKAGDTMTGALVLSGDPTLALHAATKQYVDAADAALQAQVTDNMETQRMYVKNGAAALTKGTPVYITGADGTNVIVGAASNATEGTSSKVIGLLETDLAINAMGYVVTGGKCTNIDTSGAGAAGDPVWLGVDGAKIYGLAGKPSAPAHLVYLGVVSRKNANTGEIEVNVQNGFELQELHNVQINSGTLATGQALTYDASISLWKNATPVSTLAGLSDVTFTSPVSGQVVKYDGTKWVNGSGGAGGVTAQATAPTISTASNGDAWFNTTDGTMYVCFVDVDATKQWVQVQANSALGSQLDTRVSTLEAVGAGVIKLNPQTITANYSIPAGQNGMSAGPITIASGVTVTVPNGSAWSIV